MGKNSFIEEKFFVDKERCLYDKLTSEEFSQYDVGELVIRNGKGYIVAGKGEEVVRAVRTKLKTDGTQETEELLQEVVPKFFYNPQKKGIFDWLQFLDKGNKIAVHCKTKEESEDFCRKMDLLGMTWVTGGTYREDNFWDVWSHDTCYSLGVYGSFEEYTDEGYTILEWGDYMSNKEEKEDLREFLTNGRVAETRSGEKYLVVGDILMGLDDEFYFTRVNQYNENLRVRGAYSDNLSHFDIVKIYSDRHTLRQAREVSDDLLVWKREKRKITFDDIKKEFGEDIEVVL